MKSDRKNNSKQCPSSSSLQSSNDQLGENASGEYKSEQYSNSSKVDKKKS